MARLRDFWRRRRPPRDRLVPPSLGGRKRRRHRDLDDGGVPVEPNRPKDMSGGAAAALELDDEQ